MASGLPLARQFPALSRWRNVFLPFPALLVRHLSSGGEALSSNLSQQVVGSDRTIICYHPPTSTPHQNTKPLRRRKVWENSSLTDGEVTLVRRLRQEDGSIWSVATLSRLFKVSPALISRVAPPSEERMRELDEEKEMLRNMRRHKRKLFLLQRQAVS
ncbi:hypothetical protein GBAR_LOCUS19458 [Geodia barretti]|nr:hypothetical protein GBAR_LOCUS19458 [Geodia barretti]